MLSERVLVILAASLAATNVLALPLHQADIQQAPSKGKASLTSYVMQNDIILANHFKRTCNRQGVARSRHHTKEKQSE